MVVLAALLALPLAVRAYDNSRYDNFVAYWGQNSYGAANPNDAANYQKPLDFYCDNTATDVFPISFVTVANSTGGLPQIDLANICNPTSNSYFSGTSLLNCQFMASQITACQAKGKIMTLSLGGAGGSISFSTDAQANAFADTLWNLFLGGSSSTRPFGTAVLDGIDLDVEGGGNVQLATLVNRLRTHFSGASKKYYVTAAPQCPYPDGNLASTLNAAVFDAVYVQFYNNPCGVSVYNSTNFNFGTWDYWARNLAQSKDTKIYLGAPASSTAGGGFVSASSLASMATSLRKKFASFGGVMVWDMSQAYNNARFDTTIKNALVAAGGTGFTFPACSAPAFVSGTNYAGGSQVSYNNYIWQARWFSSNVPTANIADTGDWVAISACGGASIPTSSTTTTTTATSTTTSKTTTSTTTSKTTTSTTTSKTTTSTTTSKTSTSTTATPTGGSCAGAAAWTSTVAYTGGQQVTYNGHLWTAKWWTQADTPGGAAGVWTDNGACSAKRVSRVYRRARRD